MIQRGRNENEENPDRVVSRKLNEYNVIKGKNYQWCQMPLIVNTLDKDIFTISYTSYLWVIPLKYLSFNFNIRPNMTTFSHVYHFMPYSINCHLNFLDKSWSKLFLRLAVRFPDTIYLFKINCNIYIIPSHFFEMIRSKIFPLI